ncbi:MAG TPA: FixH family protein [Solirubrobacteraceae bacterium]|nr:FixH family protein [Solirubrobacteraceae bacterium]
MRRSLSLIPLALLLALAAAPPALAGGFATVGLSSTPDGVSAGAPWTVDITVLQHGRTPLEGIAPKVRIDSGGTRQEFLAKPTDKAGVYRAEVVFPTAGRWSYEVLDGFVNQAHTFPAVDIGAGSPRAAETGGGGIAAGWLWGAGAALLLAGAVLGLDRRRRGPEPLPHTPEPAA